MFKNKIKQKLSASLLILTITSSLITSGCSQNVTSETDVLKDTNISQNITKEESKNESNSHLDENKPIHHNTLSNANIHFINTGNSDSILIEQGGEFALIDAGDNDDEQLVVNYLRKQNVDKLKYIFATHPHADHIGGLDSVVDAFTVENVFVANGDADTKTYKDFILSISRKGLTPSVPLLNSEFKLGTSKFKVLSVANTNDPNNNSIVLEYTNGNDKILLMGDAEKDIENKLNIKDVDLSKVGHHGSSTSSSREFIQQVDPDYAIILVGKNNKYGHPHKSTMDTLRVNNVEVHRTDECGDIIFVSTGDGLKVDCDKGSYSYGSENKYYNSGTTHKDNYTENVDTNNTNSNNTQSNNTDTVYWSVNGKKYHSDPNCSKMKSPMSGTISESGRTPCSKCY